MGSMLGTIESQVVKRYLESHLAHKNGCKDVVGDGEKDSFLYEQNGNEERVERRKHKMCQ